MSVNLDTKFGQLYSDTQISLHQYYQSIENLLEAVRQRKTNDQYLISDILKTSSNIKDSILSIQTIQQKKFQLPLDAEQLRNMVFYRINFHYGLPRIFIEDGTPHPPWKPNF